jgi:solute:Na+ symporter, SSS family
VVSGLYIALGGIRAGIWASVFQGLTILAGGAATLIFLAGRVEGGLPVIFRTAEAAGRMNVINWGPAPTDPGLLKTVLASPNILWLAVLNGLFGSLAAFGTDHDLMQRLLTVETRAKSQKTMLLTIPASFTVLMIYLAVGTGLYVFFAQNPGLALPEKTDKIFPFFIGNVMPPLLKGLLLSTIFLASIDSPLASLSASFVTDIYRPLFRRGAADAHYLKVSRVCVVAFGIVLAALAWGFSFFDKILWMAFKIGGVTFGSLLGVFLLGLLTRRRADRANVAAMVVSALAMLVLLILSETKVIALGWSWLIIFGTLLTFALAWALGPVLEKK